MSASALPLLPEAPDDTIVACQGQRLITRAELLGEVALLAQQLPTSVPMLNLCTDRYHFAIGLLACILNGNLSLLPNAQTREALASLQRQHPGLQCLIDQGEPALPLPLIRVQAQGTGLPACSPTPLIPAEQVIAYVFTSGSTGQPQAHAKRWGAMNTNIQQSAKRLWKAAGGPCAVLGTVPFQHMYGLEASVLTPLLGGGILCSQRPFFPGDILQTLAALPQPRMLVTTPVHLRNLLDAELASPDLALILSATAPLALELAERAEKTLQAPLYEIYGSTETGQLATRRTVEQLPWEVLGAAQLRQIDTTTIAYGGHIEEDTPLNDIVELLDPQHFRLIGRNSDMVNIAGKRSSIAFLNHILTSLPGVRDGVFCLPCPEHENARLAAFVVAPERQAAEILHALRSYIDAVFLPRPIVLLDQLPRNDTGKITQNALQQLIDQHLKGGTHA